MKTLKMFMKLSLAEKMLLVAIFVPLFIVTIARIVTELKTIF
jgi:hypothetical protein